MKLYIISFLLGLGLSATLVHAKTSENKINDLLYEVRNNLPIEKDDCIKADATFCGEYIHKHFNDLCHSQCLMSKPEFLALDENRSIIYFSTVIGLGGSGGYQLMIFTLDINTKQVKKLALDFGPTEASLSPDGNYLALCGYDCSIIDTKTGKNVYIKDKASHQISSKEHVYTYMSDLKWIGENKFKFTESRHKDKFKDADIEIEKEFDLPSKKTRELSYKYN